MTNSFEGLAAIASRFINNTNRNIFLTGRAGTGKTTFLRNIVTRTHKNAIVAAPTGIAAINAGGVTLHSLFQLPFGSFLPSNQLPATGSIGVQLNTPETLLKGIKMHVSKRKMLREMELLIIDEVSMLRADLLDAVDHTLRSIRRNRSVPFGGVQVLFIGDLYQLPPVVRQEEWEYLKAWYPDMYFFSARVLQDQPPVYIELDKIFRQSDDRFISLLNHFRDNTVTRADTELLNTRYRPDFKPEKDDAYIHLTTHNRKADALNHSALQELSGRSWFYTAEIEGDFNEFLYPVESTLELKEGAQIMFIKNDYSGEHLYFNGKIGFVTSLDKDEIRVRFTDGQPDFAVSRYVWENKKFSLSSETNEIEENVAGTFAHYPIKLAWAITVHKSQGLTFEKAIIDVSSAFAPGQIYVALSRLVSLEGLVLSGRVPSDGPTQDQSLARFIQEQVQGTPASDQLPAEVRNCIRDSALYCFDMFQLLNALRYFIESHDRDELRSAKQKQKPWAISLENDFRQMKEIADKFRTQLSSILRMPDDQYLAVLQVRMEAAKNYFEPILTGFSERIKAQIRSMDQLPKTKKYRDELSDLERLFFRQRQLIYKTAGLIQAAMEDSEFTRKSMLDTGLYQGRLQEFNQIHEADEEERLADSEPKQRDGFKRMRTAKAKKVPKEEKELSDHISLEMFKQGKSLPEIAAARSLQVSTIEGHLLLHVIKGALDIDRLVSPEIISRVKEAAAELDNATVAQVREKLGDTCSYAEIRFVLARERARRE